MGSTQNELKEVLDLVQLPACVCVCTVVGDMQYLSVSPGC